MDPLIAKLKSLDECEAFVVNAKRLGREDLVNEATKRALEFRARAYGSASEVELECLKAVFAYEQTLQMKNGKKTRAQRTWNMIARHGIIPAVERAVDRREETAGYRALKEMGLDEFAFEAVILRHPSHFSPDVVKRSAERMAEFALG